MRQWWTATDRRLRIALVATLAFAVAIVAPIAWYLGSPLFIDTTVDEAFPTAVSAAPAATAVPAGAVTPTIQTTPTQAPTPTTLPTGGARVAPVSTATTGAPPTATSPAATVAAPTATFPEPSATPVPTEPVALASGAFGVVDDIHKGEGTATVYRLADGQRILRLENFRVTNGPDLYVYLSGHPAPRSSGQLHEAGDFEVDRLKANVGNQNYELPADLDLGHFKSVVIYCKRFTTIFSTAELAGQSGGHRDGWAGQAVALAASPADPSPVALWRQRTDGTDPLPVRATRPAGE